MNDCLFCKIIDNQIPSFKIYEDKDTIAILDAFPKHAGHALVIPKSHTKNYLDASSSDVINVGLVAQKVARAIEKALECDGIFLRTNINEAAEQVIFHTHMHIVPKYLMNEPDKKPTVELARKIASCI